MSKRQLYMEESQTQTQVKKRPRIRFEKVPKVEKLSDLIEMGRNFKFYKNLNSVMLWTIRPYLMELNNMVGMEDLKQTIFYQIIYYLQNMHKRNQNEEYLHTAIMGKSGCGKTTIAKILAEIYVAMGILSGKKPFTVAKRDDFIAGYLGQTAIKTKKLLKSCLGGVLFIDEVYSLGPKDNDRDSFSKEAIDTLNVFLSEHKNDFCCIIAGYEKDINQCFFGMNQGLKRRFPWVHKIKEYSSLELAEMLVQMVEQYNWEIDLDKEAIGEILEKNKELFKYAGGSVEIFFSKCKMSHSIRVFSMDEKHKFIINKEDIEDAIKMMKKHNDEIKVDDKPPPGMYL